jgi:N-acetylneuraminic acid mutarotase
MQRNYPLLFLMILGISLFSCQSSSIPYTQSGNWVTVSSFNGANRSEAACFTIGNLAFLAGGWDGIKRYNDLWQFDPSGLNGSWFQLASMPALTSGGAGTARSSAIAFSVGQEGYLGTGYDGYNYLQDFWQYDLASNSWAQKADFAGGPRFEAVGFGIGNYGYVTTGYDGLNAQKDFWRYDPSVDQWEAKISMGGTKRYSAAVFVYSNRAYLVTGVNSGTAVNDFWMYDPSLPDTSAWVEKNHITNFTTEGFDDSYTSIARWNAAAFVILGTTGGDRAYITTGENGALMSLTWEYDIANDLWYEKTPFEGVPRTGAIGFSVQNKGYCGTGRSSSQPLDDVRQFFPNEVYNAND